MIRDGEQTRPPPVAGEQSAPAAGSASRSRRVRRSSSAVTASRMWNWIVSATSIPSPHHDRPGLGAHPRSPPTTVSATQPMACSGWTSAQRAFDANSADAPWFREVTSTANETSASPSRTGPPRQPLSSRSPYPGRSRARRRSSSLRPYTMVIYSRYDEPTVPARSSLSRWPDALFRCLRGTRRGVLPERSEPIRKVPLAHHPGARDHRRRGRDSGSHGCAVPSRVPRGPPGSASAGMLRRRGRVTTR